MDDTLEQIITVRCMPEIVTRIDKAIQKNPDRFDSPSHFVRVAIMKLLKEVEQ